MDGSACLLAALVDRAPLVGAAGLALLLRWALCAPRLARRGPIVPDGVRLASRLDRGAFRGVPVREEPAGPYGGGRFHPRSGEIRLAEGMLARDDVDALAILEHERGHAARDIPAPRAYRVAMVGLFLAGLAAAILDPGGVGTTAMAVAFGVVALHILRNEAAASEYALRQLAGRGWPSAPWRAAISRLAAAFGVYLAEWIAYAAIVTVAIDVLGCRGGG